MERLRERGKHRVQVENEMIRRREKQFNYEQMWNGAEKYYQHWEKANTKFDSWTSPRYYEDNNKLMKEIKSKRDKEELLTKRREKLKKLFDEEQRTYDIELMVYRNRNLIEKPLKNDFDEIPTDVLKDVNDRIKIKEDNRRKHDAEIKLYQQWRKNNPLIRQYESRFRWKDLKLTWLDQQIEKRMQNEKEEEETRKILKERDERLKEEKENEEMFKKDLEERRQQLRDSLEKQIVELKQRQKISEELKVAENEENKMKMLLAEMEEKRVMEQSRRAERECALFNIRQHKLKLKQKALDIQENLEHEKLFITRMKQLELDDIIADDVKRNEIKEGLSEYLKIVNQQQQLEKQRQRHLAFLFDSETRAVYEKQNEIWKQEEVARQNLVKQVVETLRTQVDDKLRCNKEKQSQIIREREEMATKIEEYHKELQRLKEEEDKRKFDRKKQLDDDLKIKSAHKKQQDNWKMKEIDEELERIRKEEERLQKEILKIQKREGPVRPRRDRLFF